jgi:hypothetical protein
MATFAFGMTRESVMFRRQSEQPTHSDCQRLSQDGSAIQDQPVMCATTLRSCTRSFDAKS